MDSIQLTSISEAYTKQLGKDIAIALQPGDLVMLSGDLGVGKSVLARAIIRFLANDDLLEVPSPTYTICQSYNTNPPIFHFDFYRIADSEEATEIGLQEALQDGCAIVEWPQNALEGVVLPSDWIEIDITQETENERIVSLSGNGSLFERVLRSYHIRRFLDNSGYFEAKRGNFAADASARRYELVWDGEHQYFLMDDPVKTASQDETRSDSYTRIAHLAEGVYPFLSIAHALHNRGLSAPKILASKPDDGLILLEHLGDTGIIDSKRNPIIKRYIAAAEFLAELHNKPWNSELEFDGGSYHLPSYGIQAMLAEVSLFTDWYAPEHAAGILTANEVEKFAEIWKNYAGQLQKAERSLVLRDFHSPNILWLDNRVAANRIGIIDFQDAVIGPTSYDVASLAQDARVDVTADQEEIIRNHYISIRTEQESNFDVQAFERSYALMAAQRATKILGIFVRLNNRDGKPEYLQHIPRVKDYLQRSLLHPAMKRYREWLQNVIEL